MESPIEVIKHEGLVVKIYQDTDTQGPESWGDDNGFLVHYHRDFQQEHESVLVEDDLRDLYQGNVTDNTKELKRKYHIFSVSAYIHSGVHLTLGNVRFAYDSGGWDTSHVGAVFCAKSEWKTVKKAEKFAEGLIESWNQYLSGDVYGFVVEGPDVENAGSGSDIDSCWGFYGLEYAKEEGLAIAKHFAEERRKKKQAKVKAMIKNHVPLQKRTEVAFK